MGATAPLSYTTLLEGRYVPGSVGQAAKDLLDGVMADLWVGGTRPLHTFRFDVASPRPFELNVQIIKAQAVCVGGLLYSTVLGRPVAGEVRLGEANLLGKAKLVGDEATAAKLNAVKPVVNGFNALGFVELANQVEAALA